MKDLHPNWTRKELEAYTFIYFANADYEESDEEDNFILKNVSIDTFKRMHKIYESDNDYQSIQKIQNAVQKLSLSKAELERFFKQIKELTMADKNFNILERIHLIGLQHILNRA